MSIPHLAGIDVGSRVQALEDPSCLIEVPKLRVSGRPTKNCPSFLPFLAVCHGRKR